MEVDENRLKISPVSKLTEGTYQCYAINSYGNTQSNTRVVVQGRISFIYLFKSFLHLTFNIFINPALSQTWTPPYKVIGVHVSALL